MWHNYINELLIARGATVMQEVRVTPWLPEGWSGTADLLPWDAQARAFELWDLKTIKGEGLRFVSESAKDEHIWQLSAYWHALREGKFPMLKKAKVLYLPMNDADGDIGPIVQEITPLPKEKVWGVMEERWAATKEYISSLGLGSVPHPDELPLERYLTDALAPSMGRIQKLYKNGDKYELKLVPHWSTMFCPFDDTLCNCNTQGTTKIGEWYMGEYTHRKGYEHIDPQLSPVR